MTVGKTKNAYREMLSVETISRSISTGKMYKYDKPFKMYTSNEEKKLQDSTHELFKKE